MDKTHIFYEDETYEIIGAAIEVHKTLGPGFLESVYEEAMGIELETRDISYKTQVQLKIKYKETTLAKEFKADLIVIDKILIELKCIPKLTRIEEAQILNYLRATGLKLGLLINFGSKGKLEWKRYVN